MCLFAYCLHACLEKDEVHMWPPITITLVCLKWRHFSTQYFNYLAVLYTGTWKLTFTNKQMPQNELTETLPQTTKDFQERKGIAEAGHYCVIPKAWCLERSCSDWRTLFFHKQYREYNSEKEREAELCKQTEIVCVPIRLNRKPSQLAVYSELGLRGQGLQREHFLARQQTDGGVSGGRWQQRRMRVHPFITWVCKG